MSLVAEVGLFVDFDGFRGAVAQPPGEAADCQRLMEKARQYGPVAMAYAYADFSSYPPSHRRALEIAGITPRDVPIPSRGSGQHGGSSMVMLMDIVDCLLDNANVSTLFLVTTDPAYVRVIARARNRFGKKVVISGVEQAVSDDLIQSADLFDPLPARSDPVGDIDTLADDAALSDDETSLLQLVDWLSSHRPYMTFSFIRSHALSPHHHLGLDDARVIELLSRFKERGILIEGTRFTPDGRALRTLHLSEGHAAVASARNTAAPAFENRGDPHSRQAGAATREMPSAGDDDADGRVEESFGGTDYSVGGAVPESPTGS